MVPISGVAIMKEVVKVLEVVWLFMLVVSSVIAHLAFKNTEQVCAGPANHLS